MIAEKVYVSPDEYLRLERAAAYKSEYIDGEIIEMAGGTTNHNRIKENISGEFYIHLRGKGCRGYSSDQRVHVPTDSQYAYPDVVVVCGPNQYHDDLRDTLTNPTLIVEVLSPGTEGYDRGDKFAHYRQAQTLREYLLIDSEKVRAEVWRKHQAGYWFLAAETDQPDQSIQLASIDLILSMAAVYAETDGVIRAEKR